jgi:homogentisate phytyltransferase/homogentisate geranylgeranyltransferase
LLTAIIFVFSIIIAWFKDLPDTEGDAAHGIRTLSLSLGRHSVWKIGSWLLATMFIAATAFAYAYDFHLLAGGQLLLLIMLIVLSKQLDLAKQASIARYYQGIWVLFFLEYALFAAVG